MTDRQPTLAGRLTSRKLWAWVSMTVLATFMRYDGVIEADHWERVVTWVTIGYAFSNALQAVGLGAANKAGR